VSTPEFDPNKVTPSQLKHQPIAVVKTEIPALAEALGVTPAELFRSLTGGDAAAARRVLPDSVSELRPVDIMEPCCNNDDW